MSELKYVLIEMIENDSAKMLASSIISGLFKGIRLYNIPKEDKLIIVENKEEDTIDLLNTKKYNVLSLQKFDGHTKIIHCFRAVKEDQEKAQTILSDLIKEFDDNNRTIDGDDNIIDTSTYTCIPEDTTIIKHSQSPASVTNNRTIYNNSPNRSCAHNKTNTSINRGPQPKYFKRTKKPSKTALEKMEKRIKGIKAGTYKIALPVVKGDDDEIADVDNSSDVSYNMYGGCY